MSTIILIIFMLLAVITLLLLLVALKVMFTLNTGRENMNMSVIWLYPVFKAEVTMENAQRLLKVYLFDKQVLKRDLKAGKGKKTNNLDVFRKSKPRDVNIYASYGFKDPSITGVTCGAINAVSQLINIDEIKHKPDFVTDEDYIYVNATAKLNAFLALINYFRARRANA